MGHGGKRAGAGRKPGAGTEKTRETAVRLLGEDVTPLDYMVKVMRGLEEFDATKFEAAKAAAPYMHARLAAVEHKGEMTVRNVMRLPQTAETAQGWAEQYAPKIPAQTH